VAIKDAGLLAIIERIKEHYENNINNVHVKKAFTQLSPPPSTWDRIESLTGRAEAYRMHGYPLQDLYDMILAAAGFVSACRRDVVPNMKSLLGSTGSDKVLIDMAINNFKPNLAIFADMINELYVRAAELDREEEARKAVENTRRIEPDYSLCTFAETQPFQDAELVDRHVGGLRKAGVPE